MKDKNWANKVFYLCYWVIITCGTISNYVRDSKKKLPLAAEIVMTSIELIVLPAFITAFVYKIKARCAEKALEAEADAVPEIAEEA